MRWALVAPEGLGPDAPERWLGDWCWRVEGIAPIGARERALSHPWSEPAAEFADAARILGYYEALLPVLAGHLGPQGVRYWEIVLGPWLMHFTQIALERCLCIRAALDEDPGFTTVGLDAASFVVTDGYSELLQRMTTDVYNLQLYTRILDVYGWPPAVRRRAKHPQVIAPPSVARRLRERVSDLFPLGPRTILTQGVPLTVVQMARLGLAGGVLVRPIFDRSCGRLERPSQPDPERRRALEAALAAVPGDPTGGALPKLIAAELPTRYLEDHAALRARVDARHPRAASAIMSSSGWLGEEAMRLYAARAQGEGTRLIGVQHGGGYGTNLVMMQEWIERRITDAYLTWGWEESEGTIPVPVPLFSSFPRWTEAASEGPILFVSSRYPRWTYRIQCAPRPPHLGRYWASQLAFFRACPKEVLDAFEYRGYRCDERLMNDHDASVDAIRALGLRPASSGGLAAQMAAARLVVVDTNGTALPEALAIGAPAIAFWDPNIHPVRPSARPVYEGLRRVGILHADPAAAAAQVSRIKDSVASWWSEPERVAARDAFARLNAWRSDEEWLPRWRDALRGSVVERGGAKR